MHLGQVFVICRRDAITQRLNVPSSVQAGENSDARIYRSNIEDIKKRREKTAKSSLSCESSVRETAPTDFLDGRAKYKHVGDHHFPGIEGEREKETFFSFI